MDSTEAIVGIIAGIVASVGVLVAIWFQFVRKTEEPNVNLVQPGMSADERERLVRVELQLAELQEKTAAPPQGSEPLETTALSAQATDKTERLLAEAIELQGKNREREAIDALYEAFQRDLEPLAKSQLHLLIGNSFLNLSEFEEAESHYHQALDGSRMSEGKGAEANALGNLGVIYQHKGDRAKAKGYHQEALAIHRETGNRRGEANQLGNLGIIYQSQGDLEEAEEHHRQALAVDVEFGYRLGEAQDLGNLGIIYTDRGNLPEAEDHLQRALTIQRDIGDRLGEARQLGNLANIFAEQGDFTGAQEYMQQSLTIHREIGNRFDQANALGGLGILAAVRNDHDEACQRLREALSIFTEIGAPLEVEQTRANLKNLGCEEEEEGGSRKEDAPGG